MCLMLFGCVHWWMAVSCLWCPTGMRTVSLGCPSGPHACCRNNASVNWPMRKRSSKIEYQEGCSCDDEGCDMLQNATATAYSRHVCIFNTISVCFTSLRKPCHSAGAALAEIAQMSAQDVLATLCPLLHSKFVGLFDGSDSSDKVPRPPTEISESQMILQLTCTALSRSAPAMACTLHFDRLCFVGAADLTGFWKYESYFTAGQTANTLLDGLQHLKDSGNTAASSILAFIDAARQNGHPLAPHLPGFSRALTCLSLQHEATLVQRPHLMLEVRHACIECWSVLSL